MKISIGFTAALLLAASLAWAADPAPPAKTEAPAKSDADSTLKTPRDKVSYSMGFGAGNHMVQQRLDIDPVAFAKGMADALAGHEPQMSQAQMSEAFQAFQKEMDAKALAQAQKNAEKNKAIAAKNKPIGDAWLAENKKKDGVKALPNGLQYKVLKEGSGATPKLTDIVTADYEGKLIDGTVFDSSIKRGMPSEFPVDRVIPGWTQALQLMKVGSKWELYIPSELAYGENTPTAAIPPGSVLIFTLDLKGTRPAPAETPAP